jgi:serine/threonine protein kinase
VVHKAIHVRKGHIVAVKIISVGSLPKEEISSIEMEIKLMRCDLCASPSVCHCVSALVCLFLSDSAVHRDLRHPNIVKYIDSKLEGSELCIVLEYVEGGSLAKIMHDVGQGLSLSLSLSLSL